MKIGCAVLAGGQSSRMGKDKSLLTFQGETFLNKICETLSGFEEKIIASGANRTIGVSEVSGTSEISGAYDKNNISNGSWNIVPDIYPKKGPIGGLHAVLSICESEALFCVSCDMPLLQKSLVEYVCSFMIEEYDAIIAVTEEGRKQPLCAIYRKSVVSILEKQILEGNYRMMGALEQMRVNYVAIGSEYSWQLKNINTPEEYLEL